MKKNPSEPLYFLIVPPALVQDFNAAGGVVVVLTVTLEIKLVSGAFNSMIGDGKGGGGGAYVLVKVLVMVSVAMT